MFASDVSNENWIQFGYDTPRAKLLKRHPANESSPEMSPQCNTVTKLMHEILSRCTVTKLMHEVYSKMLAKVDATATNA